MSMCKQMLMLIGWADVIKCLEEIELLVYRCWDAAVIGVPVTMVTYPGRKTTTPNIARATGTHTDR